MHAGLAAAPARLRRRGVGFRDGAAALQGEPPDARAELRQVRAREARPLHDERVELLPKDTSE